MGQRDETAGAPRQVGARLGRYTILEKLGAGGMGEVYRARDEDLQRDVALKVLPDTAAGDEGARTRLVREARAAASLNHPHICTIHEVARAGDQTYIAMELVDGSPLSAHVAAGALPPALVERLGIQLADALAHAHDRGILHRDLKSANIVVSADQRLKVLDFGLAKRIGPDAGTDAATETQVSTMPGRVMGTLAYMAPEQLRGLPADARSDVWAVGVVLYEMAAGRRPFEGQTSFETSAAILHSTPTSLPADVPATLVTAIMRCLAREPSERPQDARALLRLLRASDAPTASAPATVPLPQQPVRHRRAALAVAALVIVAVLAGLSRDRLRSVFGGAPVLRSVAVLPLDNLSGKIDDDYLADGFTDALITDLSKVRALRVISRTSSMRLKGSTVPLRQLATQLGVDGFVDGSVMREGNRVRVNAHLIQASTDTHLWAETYERDLRDVLRLQGEVAMAIAREIRIAVSSDETRQLTGARQVNPASYEAYLKGMYYLNKLTPEGFERGLASLQEAVDKDAGDPQAWAGLALGYSLVGHDRIPDAFARARAAARRAEELGGSLAETELALAQQHLYSDWDLDAAEPRLRRAIELKPSLAEAHRHYSWYFTLRQRYNQAEQEIRQAQLLDPLSALYHFDLGWQYWLRNEHDAAIAEARKALELNPKSAIAWCVIGNALAAKGEFAEAISAHEQMAALDRDWRWPLARIYALAGRRDDARRLAIEIAKEPTPMNAFGLTGVYGALGDMDEAYRWLEAAYTQRFSWIPWVPYDHSFAPLKDDPRFGLFVQRIGPARR